MFWLRAVALCRVSCLPSCGIVRYWSSEKWVTTLIVHSAHETLSTLFV